jgi:hypothetical protein
LSSLSATYLTIATSPFCNLREILIFPELDHAFRNPETGAIEYMCEICDRTYSVYMDMKIHRAVEHFGIRPRLGATHSSSEEGTNNVYVAVNAVI